MSDGTTTPDRCPTCFICCESEAERPEDALLATGCACSRAGASGGRAHLQCIVAAAKHDEAHWTQCSICKQQWSGPLEVGLSRARYESLSQSLPDDDIRRVIAKLNLASCQKKNGAPGALADATQLYEEVLETWRRTLGVRNQRTLTVMLNLSMAYEDAGRVEPGLALAQEALGVLQTCLAQGRRLRMGVGGSSDEEHTPEAHDTELKTRTGLLGKMLATTSRLYANTGRHAAARPLMEACVEVSKGTGDVVSQAHNMCNLGVCLSNIGDIQAGRQVKTDAVQLSQRVLGPTHPHTRAIADTAEQGRRDESESDERKARAIGRLVGLSKTELNGALVFVLDYVAAKGRYKVSTHGSETVYARQARASGAKPLGIKPENVVLKSGTAVVIGKAGPVPAALAEYEGSFDGERSAQGANTGQGEYSALLCWGTKTPAAAAGSDIYAKGGGGILSLPLGCVLLECFAAADTPPAAAADPAEPEPVHEQPSFRDLPPPQPQEGDGEQAAAAAALLERQRRRQRVTARVEGDDLPEEEAAELDGDAVTAMGCGRMVPLDEDY